ncbi:hypothetical protein HG530_008553 [Fusarium avenaceum]|nr:hypothetical protein HG530_008553 [Fusarium avenaceum]
MIIHTRDTQHHPSFHLSLGLEALLGSAAPLRRRSRARASKRNLIKGLARLVASTLTSPLIKLRLITTVDSALVANPLLTIRTVAGACRGSEDLALLVADTGLVASVPGSVVTAVGDALAAVPDLLAGTRAGGGGFVEQLAVLLAHALLAALVPVGILAACHVAAPVGPHKGGAVTGVSAGLGVVSSSGWTLGNTLAILDVLLVAVAGALRAGVGGGLGEDLACVGALASPLVSVLLVGSVCRALGLATVLGKIVLLVIALADRRLAVFAILDKDSVIDSALRRTLTIVKLLRVLDTATDRIVVLVLAILDPLLTGLGAFWLANRGLVVVLAVSSPLLILLVALLDADSVAVILLGLGNTLAHRRVGLLLAILDKLLVGLGTLLDTDGIAVLVILGPFLLWLVTLEHTLAVFVEFLFIGDTLADGRIGLVLTILDKGGAFLGTLGLTDRAIGGIFRPLLLGLFALGLALTVGVELLRVLDTLADGGVGLLVAILHESGTFLGALGLADRAVGGVFSPLLFRLGALGRAFTVRAELFGVLDTLADSLIVGAILVKLGTFLRTLLDADRTVVTIFAESLVLLGALEYTGVVNKLLGLVLTFADGVALSIVILVLGTRNRTLRYTGIINKLLGLVLAFADGFALGIIALELGTRDRTFGGVAIVVGELLVEALAFADETSFVVGSLKSNFWDVREQTHFSGTPEGWRKTWWKRFSVTTTVPDTFIDDLLEATLAAASRLGGVENGVIVGTFAASSIRLESLGISGKNAEAVWVLDETLIDAPTRAVVSRHYCGCAMFNQQTPENRISAPRWRTIVMT